jgi:predicted amidohydrolase YtcJ
MGSWEDLAAYERARDAGRLRTRVYAAVPLETWARLRDTVAAWHAEGHRLAGGLAGDRWLQIGGLKGFVDGSLGAHTAAMLAPYADARDDRGLFVTPRDSLFEWTRAAAVAGLQVMVHAIGDRAIRTQLDVFERVAGEVGARDRRWRSSTPSTSTRPTCPAWPRWAWWRACSPTTPSTTGVGPSG